MRIVRKRSGLASKMAIAIIVVAVLAIAGTVVYMNLYRDTFFAQRKFEEISRDYYENGLYEEFITEHSGEDLEEAFSKYPTGFIVKLRQILNWEFLEKNTNYRTFFSTDVYTCDTNISAATYKPHAPYGKKDYNIELNLECNKD